MYRHQRAVKVFTRQYSRASFSSAQNGSVRVQRVRFLRPMFRSRVWPKMFLWAAVINLAWVTFARRRESDDKDEEEQITVKEAVKQVRSVAQAEHVGAGGDVSSVPEEVVQEVAEVDNDEDWEDDDLVPEDQPEGAWFIPLWIAQERPQEFYSREDPEWISYVQFNEDMQRRARVKGGIVQAIHATLGKHRDFLNSLGTPIMIGKVWLELHYPTGPPPEWERLGIEITDDYVALLYRPVEPRNLSRLQNALWPKVATLSLWASCQALWHMQTERLREVWTGESSEDRQGRRKSQALETIRAVGQIGNKRDVKSPPESQQPAMPPVNVSKPEKDRTFSLPLPAVPEPSEDLQQAIRLFRRNFARNSRLEIPAPRGSMVIAGLVEMLGSKGICVLDVQAVYDPANDRMLSINATPRRARRRTLTPPE